MQAQQATNQLLALTAKQQFQIQNMMAAQYRAETIERARQAQAQIDAQAADQEVPRFRHRLHPPIGAPEGGDGPPPVVVRRGAGLRSPASPRGLFHLAEEPQP